MVSWSGFWGDSGGSTGSYDFLSGKSPNRYHLSRILRKKGMRGLREILTTVVEDSTPASTASATTTKIEAVANTAANVQGGVRSTTTQELVQATLNSDKDNTAPASRAVNSADVTALQEILADAGDERQVAPTNGSGTITYPSDASGNGGGGKGEHVG